jgi:hypothetical protein
VEFISIYSDGSAETESLIEERDGLAFRLFVSLLFADEKFDLTGHQTANRGGPFGGENFRFTKRVAVETNC